MQRLGQRGTYAEWPHKGTWPADGVDKSSHLERQTARGCAELARRRPRAVPTKLRAIEGIVAKRLRWRKEIPTLPAVASSGQGVIETFKQAAKAAARYARSVVTMAGVKAIEGTPETADQLLDDLLRLEDHVDTPHNDTYDDPDALEPEGSLG